MHGHFTAPQVLRLLVLEHELGSWDVDKHKHKQQQQQQTDEQRSLDWWTKNGVELARTMSLD